MNNLPTVLEVSDLAKAYDGKVALNPTSFRIERGEFVVILGASGCGKSTLLALIMGIVAHQRGVICLAGQRIDGLPPERRDIAMVFQSYALFPHMNVAENLAFGLKMKKVPPAERERRIELALDICAMRDYVDCLPRQLSGGQQQRVALARAIVMQPALMLYDEPLSNLDAKIRDVLREELRALHRELGATALFVTHDRDDAMLLADRIIVMDAGSIVESGTPQALYRTPRFRLTAEIFGATNLVPLQHDGEFGRLPWGQVVRLASGAMPASGSATCAIRPEALSVVLDLSGAATVVKLQFMGSSVRCEIDVAGRRLLASVDAKSTIPPAGARVALRAEEPLHILEESGAAA